MPVARSEAAESRLFSAKKPVSAALLGFAAGRVRYGTAMVAHLEAVLRAPESDGEGRRGWGQPSPESDFQFRKREDLIVAVVIRMKRMGRKNREYYRICASDRRSPRDGRVIEEIGTYDPHVSETDARCTLDNARVDHWLSVGAQPSTACRVLIKKYGTNGTHVAAMEEARARLKLPKIVPDAGPPAFVPEVKAPEPEAPAESAVAVAAPAEVVAEAVVEVAAEPAAAEAAPEESKSE
jgi:small subunit ribosomal protein S16